MWIVRWIFITVVLLALVGFIGQNQDDWVSIKFFLWHTPEMKLAYALFLAFAVGLLLALFVSILKHLQLQTEIRRLKRQIKKMHGEVEQLRNLAIEEELFGASLTEPPAGGFPATDDKPLKP